jgi:hypothetical protein
MFFLQHLNWVVHILHALYLKFQTISSIRGVHDGEIAVWFSWWLEIKVPEALLPPSSGFKSVFKEINASEFCSSV